MTSSLEYKQQTATEPLGVAIPDGALARRVTEFIRDTESTLLFDHSSRVFCFGSLAGKRKGLKFDPELLYTGAMFHDLGLVPKYSSPDQRFEVDGAKAARDFLLSHSVPQSDIEDVWVSIALHTTPGIPEHMNPVVALVTAGVEADVLGMGYSEIADADRLSLLRMFPRTPTFKEDIIQAFYDGIKHKPETTFGNVKADVLAGKDPTFQRINFCDVIRSSR